MIRNAWKSLHRPVLAVAAAWFTLGASLPVQAQEPQAAGPPAAPAVRLGADQLDDLVAPIALYPDALVALILPAATAPSDALTSDDEATTQHPWAIPDLWVLEPTLA